MAAAPATARDPSRRALRLHDGLTAGILLLTALVVAGIWLAVQAIGERERTAEIEEARRHNANLARAFEEHTVRTLDYLDELLRTLVRQFEAEGEGFDLQGYFARLQVSAELVRNAALTDAGGRVIAETSGAVGADLADRPHIRVHLERDTRRMHIGTPVTARINRQWSFVVTRRANHPDGRLLGVVAVAVNPFYFSDFYRDLDLGRGAIVSLFGLDGIVRAWLGEGSPPLGLDISKGVILRSVGSGPSGTLITPAASDGRDRIFAYRTVRGYPVVVTVGTLLSGVVAEAEERIQAYRWEALVATVAVLALGGALVVLARTRRRAADSLERLVGERTRMLNQSEALFRTLAELSPVGIVRADALGTITYVNDRWCEIAGVSRAAAHGTGWLSDLHPLDRARVAAECLPMLQRGQAYTGEIRYLRADGQVTWCLAQARAELSPAGDTMGFVGTIVDITERKRNELRTQEDLQEKETLLREVHHRVKNNLQIISSLLHFQSKHAGSPEQKRVFREGQDRLRAMILVHEKLYRATGLHQVELGDYLRALIGQLQRSYGDVGARTRAVVSVVPVQVPIEIALPCGLIVTELVTNAFKYAYAPEAEGQVRVDATRRGTRLVLSVSDDGAGLPAGLDLRQAESFGLHLVASLAEQLGATLERLSGPGTTITLALELPPGIADEAPADARPRIAALG